ncbi:MAG: U32 family peptidase, partial [Acutalibacteraceae bacterium]
MSIEILSPCGSKECVLPAVSNGADAIYLGMKEFSARKDAQNFDFEELSKTISYCHRRGVKVYLALNTVVFDKEMASALEIVCKCRNMGIDALIVQDLGLVREVKKLCPDLPLHASTQMSVHTLSGAKLLSKLGFKRVVLAREMSLSEIAEICENVDIETEVFVHGANCMCVSGQCYMSSMIGTRSGNRGACAQPCRKPYKIEGNEGYPLSLKDNSSIEHILDLQSLGVTSVKIEGRMKRPEYVAVSTRACFLKREQGFIEEETKEQLKKVFSRTGFTDGYIKGKLGKDMFGFRQKRDVLSADEKLYKNIRSSYKTEIKRFGVSFDFYEKEGFPYLLATNFENSVEIKGSAPFEEAINTPLTKEKVFSLLKKLGGTPFMCKDIRSDIPAGKTVSASVINEMRRKALEFLLSEREKSYIKKEQVKFSPEVLAYRRYVPKDKKEKRLNIKGFSRS